MSSLATATARAGAAAAPAKGERVVKLAAAPTPTFEAYRDGLLHDWLRTLTALGFSLIPLFLILDYFTMPPELLRRFAVYRLAATGVVLGQYFWVRRSRPSPRSYVQGYFYTVVTGGMIVLMTVDLGGFSSGYYAGLNLVIIAVNLLLPWRAVHSAINGVIILVMYVLANHLFGHDYEAKHVINNLYFMGATVVIAVAINYTKHRLIEQEFYLRAELLQTNADLDHSRAELKSARDALWSEMEIAKRIQTALLPTNRRLGPYDICAVMQPADEVGGDYYDFMETREGEHWVSVGDVSGHGVESGLVMMMTQTSLMTAVNEAPQRSPSEVYRSVNGVLRENISRLGTHRYMTLSLLRLLEDRLVVAGKHQDLFLWRKATGKVEIIPTDGCWIGVVPDTKGFVPDLEVPMGQGDLLLLFTDGVTEAANPSGEMYGEDRLAQVISEIAELPLEDGLKRILTTVTRFREKQEDDVTLVLLRKTDRA